MAQDTQLRIMSETARTQTWVPGFWGNSHCGEMGRGTESSLHKNLQAANFQRWERGAY